MAIIGTGIFTEFIDKVAAQYSIMKTAIEDFNAVGPSSYFDIFTASNDPDVEIPIEQYADLADTTITLTGVLKVSMPAIFRVINSINAHFARVAFAGGYDQYMINNNIRASDYFNQMYVLATGSYLLAKNVFCQDDVVMGTVNLTAGPTVGYVAGVSFGNGSIPNRYAKDGNFAASQVKIVVMAFGGVQCDLTLTGTDKDNNVITVPVVIPLTANIGDEINVGISTDRFLAVGGVAFTSGSNHGTSGDQFEIHNIKERTI